MITPDPGPPFPERLRNSDGDDSAPTLLEALWRAEELSGALAAAQREITTLRAKLADSEQTIAELTELGDAAQAAIDRLRAALKAQTEEATRAGAERDAVAGESFEQRTRAAAELAVLGAALYRAAEGGVVEAVRVGEGAAPRQRGLRGWPATLRRLIGLNRKR